MKTVSFKIMKFDKDCRKCYLFQVLASQDFDLKYQKKLFFSPTLEIVLFSGEMLSSLFGSTSSRRGCRGNNSSLKNTGQVTTFT